MLFSAWTSSWHTESSSIANRRRVIAYTRDRVCVVFQGDKHGALPQTMYDSRWHGQLRGWLESLTLEDEVRQDVSLPRVVCKYEDVFRMSYRNYLHRGMYTFALSYTLVRRPFL